MYPRWSSRWPFARRPDGRRRRARVGTVELRDVASGKVTATLAGHQEPVACVVFSPDGKTVATASYDRTVEALGRRHRRRAEGRSRGTRTGSSPWRFRPTARPWPPAATTGRSSSGTRPRAASWPRSKGTRRRSAPWRSRPTARPWPRPGPTGSSSSGTSACRDRAGDAQGAQGNDPRPGLRARRQDAGLGRRGSRDQALGRGQGRGDEDARRAHRHGLGPGLRPAGLHAGVGGLGPDDPDLGLRRHGAGRAAGARPAGHGARLLPQRPAAGLGQP